MLKLHLVLKCIFLYFVGNRMFYLLVYYLLHFIQKAILVKQHLHKYKNSGDNIEDNIIIYIAYEKNILYNYTNIQ